MNPALLHHTPGLQGSVEHPELDEFTGHPKPCDEFNGISKRPDQWAFLIKNPSSSCLRNYPRGYGFMNQYLFNCGDNYTAKILH